MQIKYNMRPATTTEAYRLGQKDMLNKICEWLEKNAEEYIWFDDELRCCGMKIDFINDLKNAMKED